MLWPLSCYLLDMASRCVSSCSLTLFIKLGLIISCFHLPWPLKDLSGVPRAPVLGGLQFYRIRDYSSANIKKKKQKKEGMSCAQQTATTSFMPQVKEI